jgi:AAA15 family ATPase/GTPase
MSESIIKSLGIHNYRCFEHFTIEKLGQVNLIVGKNSVGKTALLEALWLLVSGSSWSIIHKILYDRNELVVYNLPGQVSAQLQTEGFFSLANGRKRKLPLNFGIASNKVMMALTVADTYEGLKRIIQNDDKVVESSPWLKGWPDLPEPKELEYQIIEESKKHSAVFIPTTGLIWQAVSSYWDDMALTDKEDDIISCLQFLDPDITRFTFKGENMKDRVRYSVVKSGRFPDPVPLATMGEGIQRVFAIALAMSTASNGYLLIDEVETGLYHQVQADVWRAIFKLAHEWNVQVFATTHSWDCVEAFQEAAAEDQNEEAMLIRLQHKRSGDGIEAVLYDEELLAKATRQQVEVR